MSGKTLVTVGFVSMLAATLAVSASDSFAADAQGKQGKKEMAASEGKKQAKGQKRVDVMETPSKKKGIQPDSMSAKEERKDVIDEVGSKGDVYPSTGGRRKDVQEKINE